MKQFKIFFILMLLAFIGFNAEATDLKGNSINLKGESNTSLGNYEVKELTPVETNGVLMRAFEISYDKAQKTVLIYLDERANCRDYIVRSKNLEVRYTCRKASFGVQQLLSKQMKYKPELNSLFLNQEEFERQGKISEGGLSVDLALGMIACYYPNLLKRADLLD